MTHSAAVRNLNWIWFVLKCNTFRIDFENKISFRISVGGKVKCPKPVKEMLTFFSIDCFRIGYQWIHMFHNLDFRFLTTSQNWVIRYLICYQLRHWGLPELLAGQVSYYMALSSVVVGLILGHGAFEMHWELVLTNLVVKKYVETKILCHFQCHFIFFVSSPSAF